ncbi:MAG TPA: NADH-quinone oxidoreductase subunit A [Desulfobulbus sp.]|nr:NADH-quinone oxidoreductase subunit A [Desulfobulbus sp.]
MTEHTAHAGALFHAAPPPDPELVADGFVLAIFLLFGVIFAVAPLVANYLLAPRSRNPHIGATYECGIPAFGQATSSRFGVFYYLYALIFIVFEVDVLYLFPIARIYRQGVGLAGFLEMLVFVVILFMAIVYAWKKGVLQWEREALSLR